MAQVSVMLSRGGRPENVKPRGDCSVRALATYMDLPYDEVESFLKAEAGYNPERGVLNFDFYRIMKELGLTRTHVKIRLNSKNAAERLPNKCILLFRNHVAAYENGVVYDVFNTIATPGCKQIMGYFA